MGNLSKEKLAKLKEKAELAKSSEPSVKGDEAGQTAKPAVKELKRPVKTVKADTTAPVLADEEPDDGANKNAALIGTILGLVVVAGAVVYLFAFSNMSPQVSSDAASLPAASASYDSGEEDAFGAVGGEIVSNETDVTAPNVSSIPDSALNSDSVDDADDFSDDAFAETAVSSSGSDRSQDDAASSGSFSPDSESFDENEDDDSAVSGESSADEQAQRLVLVNIPPELADLSSQEQASAFASDHGWAGGMYSNEGLSYSMTAAQRSTMVDELSAKLTASIEGYIADGTIVSAQLNEPGTIMTVIVSPDKEFSDVEDAVKDLTAQCLRYDIYAQDEKARFRVDVKDTYSGVIGSYDKSDLGF